MSGFSDQKTCPNCGKLMNTYEDYKPHDNVSGDCPHCGFQYWTAEGQMDLTDLNELRAEFDLKPLKKLPKIN